MKPSDPRWKVGKRRFPKGAIPAQIIANEAAKLSGELVAASREFEATAAQKVADFEQLLDDLSPALMKNAVVKKALGDLRAVARSGGQMTFQNAVLGVSDAAVDAVKQIGVRLATTDEE